MRNFNILLLVIYIYESFNFPFWFLSKYGIFSLFQFSCVDEHIGLGSVVACAKRAQEVVWPKRAAEIWWPAEVDWQSSCMLNFLHNFVSAAIVGNLFTIYHIYFLVCLYIYRERESPVNFLTLAYFSRL